MKNLVLILSMFFVSLKVLCQNSYNNVICSKNFGSKPYDNILWINKDYYKTLLNTKSLFLSLQKVESKLSMFCFVNTDSNKFVNYYYQMNEGVSYNVVDFKYNKAKNCFMYDVYNNYNESMTDSSYCYCLNELNGELTILHKQEKYKQTRYCNIGVYNEHLSPFDSLINKVLIAGRYYDGDNIYLFIYDGTCNINGVNGRYRFLLDIFNNNDNIMEISINGIQKLYLVSYFKRQIVFKPLEIKSQEIHLLDSPKLILHKSK